MIWQYSSRIGRAEELNSRTTWGVDAWYDESSGYNYFSELETTGKPPLNTSHFTQVIWNNTCKVGCGTAGDYLVCRYFPAGNVIVEGPDPYKLYKENVLSF